MLKKILAVLIILIIGFVGYAASRPSEFHITRSILVMTPASAIFSHVNDLHQWDAWSPWAKLDPNAKNYFEGPATGIGSIMRWTGNYDVGEGSMTITESHANELIRFKLEFLKPFKATNSAEFTFKPVGDHTIVTWSMSGTSNLIGKVMGLIFNRDKMVGEQFEKGLMQLKAVAEGK